MATRRTKSGRVLRYSEGFTAGLSSAVLEWLLIFLLFVNALLSYLVTKFARYCKLKIPCLLCSRLDHIFGNEKPGFYRDLICGAHKLEISSLVFCHVHDKLADVHGMCEGCLFSFEREKKSSSETYRLLAGKLGIDHELHVDKDTLFKHPMLHSSSERLCSCCNELCKTSCCNELCKTRPFTHRLFPRKSPDSEVATRRPSLVGHRGFNLFDGLKKRRTHMGGRGFDPLSHIGYSELKVASDSESEVPLSDEDDTTALTRETTNPKEEFVAQRVPPERCTVVSDTSYNASAEASAQTKLITQASTHVPSLPHRQNDVGEPNGMASSATSVVSGHGLEELNWQPFEKRSHDPVISDLVAPHVVPSSSNTAEAAVEVSRGSGTSKSRREGASKLECFTPVTLLNSEEQQVVEESGETSDVLQTSDARQIFSNESGEASKSDSMSFSSTGPGLEREQASNTPGPAFSSLADLGDAYKVAVGSKEGQPSSMFSEKHVTKDSAKTNEGPKLLLTHIHATQGSDTPVNDLSPRVRGLCEELKIPDGSSSIELDTLQKRISIERNESGSESFDGSIVSEIEGESLLDRMKRQVEYDRKCMSDLYKELDEERNASAVAANQAMAMITRLQEEKAALHMEALQYLRMMEEQAEYDVEALQKANDLLAEREKEIQDLESDLDYYRIKYPEEDEDECIQVLGNDNVANMRVEHSALSCTVNNSNGSRDLWFNKKSEDNGKTEITDAVRNDNHMSIGKDSLLNFEDERLYISQYLKKLENKLNLCSDNGIHTNMCNGIYSGEEHGLNETEQDHHKLVIQERNQMDEDGSSVRKDSQLSRGGSPIQGRTSPSAENPRSVCQGNHYLDRPDVSITSTATDLVSIESEVLDLNERLETLEADKDFLEHTINSLQNGNEGVKLIQEIAYHLQELRRIGIRRREKDVA